MKRNEDNTIEYISTKHGYCCHEYSDERGKLCFNGHFLSEIISIPWNIWKIDVCNNHLKSLKVPDGVHAVQCRCNPLQHVELSRSVTYVNFNYTNLRSLELHEGVEEVFCVGTNIERLRLPFTTRLLYCDARTEVENLNEVMRYNPDAAFRFATELS